MNKEKYLADRKILLDEVQSLIDEGKNRRITSKDERSRSTR